MRGRIFQNEKIVKYEKMNMLKGSKWGLLCGSVIMIFVLGLMPYYNEHPLPVSRNTITAALWAIGLPIIAGVVAGVGVKSSWGKPLAGALCGVPATITYWYLIDVNVIGDGVIAPVMALWAIGLGAVGGLISSGICAVSKYVHQT